MWYKFNILLFNKKNWLKSIKMFITRRIFSVKAAWSDVLLLQYQKNPVIFESLRL